MNIEIKIEKPNKERLKAYSKISIAYTVETVLTLKYCNNGLRGIEFIEEKVTPYIKTYDSPSDNPSLLMDKFDIGNWRVVSAYVNDVQVGGAIIAYNTEGIHMLEGKKDLAVLWDLRVDEAYRFKGIGSRLVKAAVNWARKNDCNRLKIETQNINSKACKFYASQGAKLSSFNKHAYSDTPDEVQMIWSIDIEQ